MKIIQFKITNDDLNRPTTHEAFSKVFGDPVKRLQYWQGHDMYDRHAIVRCTPEQFGLFIAYRAEAIRDVDKRTRPSNQIANLDVKVIETHTTNKTNDLF